MLPHHDVSGDPLENRAQHWPVTFSVVTPSRTIQRRCGPALLADQKWPV